MLGKVVGNLDIWLQAENVVLVKRVILSMSQIYRVALKVCKLLCPILDALFC